MSASRVIRMPMCKICGRPVRSQSVAFGVAGKPLFYTHQGKCSDMVQDGVDATGKLVRVALEIANPSLVKKVKKGISTFQRVMRALSEEG